MFFVSDVFVDKYIGGAELTSEAIISSAPCSIQKIESSALTIDILKANRDKYWVFGNFSAVAPDVLIYAAKNINYSIIEYDYKYCKYRSPDKHIFFEQKCDCQHQITGKTVSVFFAKSRSLWFMSEAQKQFYEEKFAFLKTHPSYVLSSVFNAKTLNLIKDMRVEKKDEWLIVDNGSWIKGAPDAITYAKENNLKYILAQNYTYKKMLKTLASCKGLIFLPRGMDTCPRLVIEAKLLDCELIINEKVQHATEEWFADKQSILSYLETRADFFWNKIIK
ncbi:MAG: hypothetical protein CML45_03630 [Rhodobacteraceae bacterium]|nr:hypothetical protein [Paracoccaceae bacterium]|tara:strand:+ start:272 stop:1105 length:834 start_codon:yes stop_codon:yes gene_type:complete